MFDEESKSNIRNDMQSPSEDSEESDDYSSDSLDTIFDYTT